MISRRGFLKAFLGSVVAAAVPLPVSSKESVQPIAKVLDLIKDDGWHHVAMTVEGDTAKLYIDGELISNSTYQAGEHFWETTMGVFIATTKEAKDKLTMWRLTRGYTQEVHVKFNGRVGITEFT